MTAWQFCPHEVVTGHTTYKLLGAQTTCVLGMAIDASSLPRGFQNPLQKNSSRQQLLKGSRECAGINSWDWKILLSQFCHWLQIGGHHADNSADQEVHHPLTREQCRAETFCTCKAREGPCSHPGHKDTTFMTEQGHQVRNGGKKGFDTLVCNYISRSVAQEIYLNYTSHSFNIK